MREILHNTGPLIPRFIQRSQYFETERTLCKMLQ